MGSLLVYCVVVNTVVILCTYVLDNLVLYIEFFCMFGCMRWTRAFNGGSARPCHVSCDVVWNISRSCLVVLFDSLSLSLSLFLSLSLSVSLCLSLSVSLSLSFGPTHVTFDDITIS